MKKIILDFGSLSIDADLYDSHAANTLYESLPRTISLEQWGNELYGPVGVELDNGKSSRPKLVSEIPPGGIAYSKRGNYLCIFFGQKPAWEVEEIGRIRNTQWRELAGQSRLTRVTIRSAE
ncbi:MAG TPA: cyclophilin-like fold protein [Spirochaetota bacterium]|nr:cyclophilin-like fold protein [Spirochaetota bacterium]HSA16028.1 cyclophilin-like fold protein [Spirochaetota bacterium]